MSQEEVLLQYQCIRAFLGASHGDIDNNITMQSIWKKFEWVRSEQLMEGVTISTEDKVKIVLEGRGEYSHGKAQGLGGVGALSVGK